MEMDWRSGNVAPAVLEPRSEGNMDAMIGGGDELVAKEVVARVAVGTMGENFAVAVECCWCSVNDVDEDGEASTDAGRSKDDEGLKLSEISNDR
jgi:hypothetical protein